MAVAGRFDGAPQAACGVGRDSMHITPCAQHWRARSTRNSASLCLLSHLAARLKANTLQRQPALSALCTKRLLPPVSACCCSPATPAPGERVAQLKIATAAASPAPAASPRSVTSLTQQQTAMPAQQAMVGPTARPARTTHSRLVG